MSRTLTLPTLAPHADEQRRPSPEAADLAAELRRTVRGEVRFDDGSRALYAADLSMYRQVPIGVVIPRDLDDVVATVAACHRRGVPILGRGCGTSLAGQCCNVAVVIDFSKYVNHITELDPDRRTVWVEPGVICDQLRDAAEKHHLTPAPDPATHAYCTLGGMIGNNSCGVHSVMGGKTSDNTGELEVLTCDGLCLRVGPTSAADLDRLVNAGVGKCRRLEGRTRCPSFKVMRGGALDPRPGPPPVRDDAWRGAPGRPEGRGRQGPPRPVSGP